MRRARFFQGITVLVLLTALGGALVTGAASPTPDLVAPAAPLVAGAGFADPAGGVPEVRTRQLAAPIIVDHTCTDISQIPPYWIEQARTLVVHYAHTSHGSQVLSGLRWLEGQDATYNVDIEASGTVVLPDDTTALRIYDGNNYPGDTYITPDQYWETEDGIDHTRSVADTGWFNFSLWTWCGQMSSYGVAQIQEYVDVMAQLESEYPDMRFIYYTGHTDGTAPGSTLWRNNDMVRQYVQDNDKVLFDFADIETYDPTGGGPYYNDSEGNCTWCVDWCNDHPADCADLPADCAHSDNHPEDTLFCKLKGQAFWWLMARLAGWPGPEVAGPSKAPSALWATTGQTVTYTIVVGGLQAPLTATAYLTDVVPAGLAYIEGSLQATAGNADDSNAPALHWSGALAPDPAVTLTYAVTVTALTPQAITNTVTIGVPGYETVVRTATLTVNAYLVFLPLVGRSGP